MAKGRINKTNVDKLLCPTCKAMDILWDDALRGFGVVVLPSGRKTFIVQWKRHGRLRNAKIGLHGPTTAEQARSQAAIVLGEVESGGDPIAERKAARAVRTFRENSLNPATRLERYRENRCERFLSSDELARLGDTLRLAETKGLPWQNPEPQSIHGAKPESRRSVLDPFAVAAIRLLILTGMRPHEVLNLEWSHVDFERGALFLPDSKTGRKSVIIGGPALDVLAVIPRLTGCRFVIVGRSLDGPRPDINRPWEAVRRCAGLEGIRLYDLRHSFASIGDGASLGLPIVGKLLGHSQAATTHRYAHLDADPLRRAADMIANSIATAMAGRDRAEAAIAVNRLEGLTPCRRGGQQTL